MRARDTNSFPRFFTVGHKRLLGGEHPCAGGDDQTSQQRLMALLDMGVTTFVDLTEPDRENGVQPYRALLRGKRFRGLAVHHHALPIRDTSVPTSREHVLEALDVIDAALANGETVYVHCRSGVGRTGTMLALHLVRHGSTPLEALRQVQVAWQRDVRSKQWPDCPQTDAQRAFVRDAWWVYE